MMLLDVPRRFTRNAHSSVRGDEPQPIRGSSSRQDQSHSMGNGCSIVTYCTEPRKMRHREATSTSNVGAYVFATAIPCQSLAYTTSSIIPTLEQSTVGTISRGCCTEDLQDDLFAENCDVVLWAFRYGNGPTYKGSWNKVRCSGLECESQQTPV